MLSAVDTARSAIKMILVRRLFHDAMPHFVPRGDHSKACEPAIIPWERAQDTVFLRVGLPTRPALVV